MEEIRAFQNDNAQRMTEIGKRLGTDVKFFEGDPNINGHYKDGSIHINVNSERSLEYVFGHELYHYLRDQTHNQDLDRLTNFLLGEAKDLLMPQGDLNTLVQAKIEQYGAYGEELTGYQAKEELLADAVGKLLENEGAIERLIRYDQGMFQKVRYWVEDMIARFRGTPEERRFLQAQRLLERAVEKSSGILSGESKTGAYSYVGTDSNGIRHYESDYVGVSKKNRIKEFKNNFISAFNGLNVEIDNSHGKKVPIIVDRFTRGKNLSTGSINVRTKFQSDFADILENATYVKSDPEPSYQTNIPPKNDAHKNVVDWDRYEAVVNLGGDEFIVRFSIANKVNGEHRLYYIGLERKNAGMPINTSQNGIVNNQIPANQNIPQQNQVVNTQGTKFSLDGSLYEKRGRGYVGKSMSVNAQAAYQNNEMPMSKWTKKAMLEAIEDVLYDQDLIIDGLENMTAAELKRSFLVNSSWHHTGALYNQTDFYKIDENKLFEAARSITEEDIAAKEAAEKLRREALAQKNAEKAAEYHAINDAREKLEKELGFELNSVANYIRENPYTIRVSKKGREFVEFSYDGHEYSVPLDEIKTQYVAGYMRDYGRDRSEGAMFSLGGDVQSPGGDVAYQGQLKTRSLYESAAESDLVHSKVRENLLHNIENEAAQAMYRVMPNAETKDAVYRRLETQGFDRVEAGIEYKLSSNEKMTAEDMLTAIGLIEHYSKAGELERAQSMIASLSVIGTELGQAVQIMRMLKHSTPQGALMRVEKALQRINANLTPEQQIELSKDRVADILNSQQGSKDLERAVRAAEAEINSKVPPTWWDKWNAWRYMSMLANPRTHIRNIIGNGLFVLPKTTKDVFGAALESIASRTIDPNMERTKTLRPVDREMKAVAEQLFKEYQETLTGHGKENTQLDRRIFKNDLLEGVRRFNSGALEAEDAFFLSAHFKKAVAKYLVANKIKAKDVANILTDKDGKQVARMKEAKGRAGKVLQDAMFEQVEKTFDKTTLQVYDFDIRYRVLKFVSRRDHIMKKTR